MKVIKRKPPVTDNGKVAVAETLEQRRIREAETHEAIRRAAARAGQKQETKVPEVKVPVTLNTVYYTFLKRLKATPVKVMKSEERDQFGSVPKIIKIEVRFLDLPRNPVMAAMKGLTVRSPVSKVRDMSYTHMALWGHKSKVISFRVSMFRYRDKSVLFIFTHE